MTDIAIDEWQEKLDSVKSKIGDEDKVYTFTFKGNKYYAQKYPNFIVEIEDVYRMRLKTELKGLKSKRKLKALVDELLPKLRSYSSLKLAQELKIPKPKIELLKRGKFNTINPSDILRIQNHLEMKEAKEKDGSNTK